MSLLLLFSGNPPAGNNGALNETLGALTLSATGQALADGSLSETLGALTLSGTGQALADGSLSETLGALTLSASGAALISATLNEVLGSLTLVGFGVDGGPTASAPVSFLYPHTITISRPIAAPIAGNAGYGALSRGNETIIFSGIAANIVPAASGGHPTAGVPSDTLSRSTPWKVIAKPSDIPPGSVHLRDVVTDENGQRYQVVAPHWNPLECNLRVEMLEA